MNKLVLVILSVLLVSMYGMRIRAEVQDDAPATPPTPFLDELVKQLKEMGPEKIKTWVKEQSANFDFKALEEWLKTNGGPLSNQIMNWIETTLLSDKFSAADLEEGLKWMKTQKADWASIDKFIGQTWMKANAASTAAGATGST